MVRPEDEPRLLFLYDAAGAIGEPAAASHFGRVCAGSITRGGRSASSGVHCAGDQRELRLTAKSTEIHQRFLNAN